MNRTELAKVRKIYYMSDLHIDSHPKQDPLDLPYHPNDGVILLGDYSNNFNKTTQYITSLASRFKWVVFILGNHDYYNTHAGLMGTTFLHCIYPYPDNVYFLERNTVFEIGAWSILGDTLWSDYFNDSPLEKIVAQDVLADFKYIVRGDHKQLHVTPDDLLEAHQAQLLSIKNCLDSLKHKKVILCTHHGISKQSIHPKYTLSGINGSFVSDLEYLFSDYPNIKYALHGHCHDVFKYKIDKTKVRCNPLGYKGERNITFQEYYQTLDFIKL